MMKGDKDAMLYLVAQKVTMQEINENPQSLLALRFSLLS